MSTTIRLAKIGKKNSPTYKIVVSVTRDKRNGKFLDVIGFYNPSAKSNQLLFDERLYAQWKKKGALSTPAVEKIRSKTYVFTPYQPKKAVAETAEKQE